MDKLSLEAVAVAIDPLSTPLSTEVAGGVELNWMPESPPVVVVSLGALALAGECAATCAIHSRKIGKRRIGSNIMEPNIQIIKPRLIVWFLKREQRCFENIATFEE